MDRYQLRSFVGADSGEIEDAMERGEVVFFDRCPVELPNEADLQFMREGLPRELQVKNISYHPESDSIPRFEAAAEVKTRMEQILRMHGKRVEEFLRRSCPDFVPGWTLGTTSFRSIEEQGRKLPPRSSNELVHIDAGAYGATNGARIFRFFVNIHPTRDRVWGTKGSFEDLMRRHRPLWDAARGGRTRVPIRKRMLDRAFSGMVAGASKVYPVRFDRITGNCCHEHGTARMGDDPETSVVNAWCRAHDVPNLYVLDGSVFPTASGATPTLTIMANAWRCCEHIVRERSSGARSGRREEVHS